jgi:hypothetical protein
MKNGEMRRGPCSSSVWCSRSITSNPPIPLPMYTPICSAVSGVAFSPEPDRAHSAAAMANWMKRPIFLISFFSM